MAVETKSLETKVLNADNRGSITQVKWYQGVEAREGVLIETNAGFARGGEVHPTRQHAVQLDGLAGWIVPRKEGGKEYKMHELHTDFSVERNVPHVYMAFTHSVMLKWLEGGKFVATYVPEYRSIVTDEGIFKAELEKFRTADQRIDDALKSALR